MCLLANDAYKERERERERERKCVDQESSVLQSAWHMSRNTFRDLFSKFNSDFFWILGVLVFSLLFCHLVSIFTNRYGFKFI